MLFLWSRHGPLSTYFFLFLFYKQWKMIRREKFFKVRRNSWESWNSNEKSRKLKLYVVDASVYLSVVLLCCQYKFLVVICEIVSMDSTPPLRGGWTPLFHVTFYSSYCIVKKRCWRFLRYMVALSHARVIVQTVSLSFFQFLFSRCPPKWL